MRALLLAFVLVSLPSIATAADQRLDGLVAALNQAGTTTPAKQAEMIAGIARAVSLSADALRAEQARADLPWGDLFISHRIATRGGHPIEKVFGARRTGASWKLIAEEGQVDEAELEKDLLRAFPNLTPIEVPLVLPRAAPPVIVTPPAPAEAVPAAEPTKKPTPVPEKKRGVGDWFRDLFTGQLAPESPEDKNTRRQEEIRDFMRGTPRR